MFGQLLPNKNKMPMLYSNLANADSGELNMAKDAL
jgi:hypothetical protein